MLSYLYLHRFKHCHGPLYQHLFHIKSFSKLLLSLSYVHFCILVTPKAACTQWLDSCAGEDCWHLIELVVIFCHFTLNAVLWDLGYSQVKLMVGRSRGNMIFQHHTTDIFCSNSTQWLLLFQDSF